MAWRGLHISASARLSLERANLKVVQDDDTKLFPIEDISWIILDTKKISLTASLLSLCAEKGVVVIVSDDKHIPCGVLLPFNAHFRQLDVTQQQMSASTSLKQNLWQSIVRAKITNQAQVLRESQREGLVAKEKAEILQSMTRVVKTGDKSNVEARAARFYWSALFDDFARNDSSDVRNAMLNYGYAILRSALARFLAVSGLLPFLGVHHRSLSNPFNLADDLIEVYRPWVDALALSLARERAFSKKKGELLLDDRRRLASVLTLTADMEGQRLSLLNAMERSVDSLVRSFREKRPGLLLLPVFSEHLPCAD